jgi:hypothetical protein
MLADAFVLLDSSGAGPQLVLRASGPDEVVRRVRAAEVAAASAAADTYSPDDASVAYWRMTPRAL